MYREGGPGKPAPGNPRLENPRSVTLARQRWFGSAGSAALVWQTHVGVLRRRLVWRRGRKHKNREVRQSGLPNSGMFSDAR